MADNERVYKVMVPVTVYLTAQSMDHALQRAVLMMQDLGFDASEDDGPHVTRLAPETVPDFPIITEDPQAGWR